MTRKVFNYGGGMHSPTALTAFLRDALDGDVADGMVVSAGSGMNVTVGAGTARVGRDPSYDINITGTETVNVGAASPSNPMNSLIVAYVDRSVAGSTSVTDNTNDVFKLKAVDGAAATSPADPSTSAIQAAIGATNPYIVLARVRKRAGSTSILSTDITDIRNMVTLKAGRISAPNILANNLINSDHLANGIVLPRHLGIDIAAVRLDNTIYDNNGSNKARLKVPIAQRGNITIDSSNNEIVIGAGIEYVELISTIMAEQLSTYLFAIIQRKKVNGQYEHITQSLNAPHHSYAGTTISAFMQVSQGDRVSIVHDCIGKIRGQYSYVLVKAIG